MATFPTSADFERPVPRVERRSPGIATYRTEAGPAPSNAGADAAFAQGQQTIDLGKEMDRFGAMLDETSAQDALNQLRLKRQELTLDPEKGFQRIKGGAVLQRGAGGKPWAEEWSGQFQTAADEIGGKLLSPRAKAMFRQAAGRESMAYKRDLAVHLAGESERYEAAVYKDTQTNVLNEAITADPDKLDALIVRAESAARNRATQLGLPPEAAMATARSDVVSSAIKAKLAANDPGALTLFNLYRDRLDAKDRVLLENQVKTIAIGQNARAFAAGPSTVDEAKGRDAVIAARIAAGDDHETAVAWAANLKHESGFSPGATNPKDGRDGSDSIGLGQWNGARAQALQRFALSRGMDPSATETQLAYLQAEVDGTIPQSVSGVDPGFKARLKTAKTAEEKAHLISTQFFRPAGGDGEGRNRGATAAKYRGETDPLKTAVNAATPGAPTAPAEGPKGFLDTKKMLIDLEMWRESKYGENAKIHASNPDQMSANKQAIDQRYGLEKQRIEIAKLQLDKAVDDWMTKGGPNGAAALDRPPPEVWNQLTYEKQRSIDSTLAHNAKGQDAITDQQTWYTIQQGLTSADPAVRGEWANKPLWEFKSKLSNQDFQELAKMQGAARKGDPEKQLTHVRNINQLVDDTLLRMKVDTTPKPGSTDAERAQKFRRAVQERITLLEAEKGKKSTPEEQQKIIDALALEVRGTGGWFSSNKRRYDMKIDDVPQAERNKIVDALKRAGHTATDDMIIDLFARKNAVPAR